MCLISLAIGQHPRFPLVIASNRDEFLDRPSAALDWWQPDASGPAVLGGRDLKAGGTWMGIGAGGRIALLTNVRDPSRLRPGAPSRGATIPAWLAARDDEDAFWQALRSRGHNPFNLLVADTSGSADHGRWWWSDDRSARPLELGVGIHGLSNAALATPWPKVQRLDRAMARALAADAGPGGAARLEAALFDALADRVPVADDDLPDTGIGRERERWLATAFIRSPDGGYGTRCSTLVIVERQAKRCTVSVVERSFDRLGGVCGQRAVRGATWPLAGPASTPVLDEAVNAG